MRKEKIGKGKKKEKETGHDEIRGEDAEISEETSSIGTTTTHPRETLETIENNNN